MQAHELREDEHELRPEGDDDQVTNQDCKIGKHGPKRVPQLDFRDGADDHKNDSDGRKDEADSHGPDDYNSKGNGLFVRGERFP